MEGYIPFVLFQMNPYLPKLVVKLQATTWTGPSTFAASSRLRGTTPINNDIDNDDNNNMYITYMYAHIYTYVCMIYIYI